MHKMQLKISEKVYHKFIWLMTKFNKDEVEIVSESSDFTATKYYLQQELNEIESGKANFISQQEFEVQLSEN